MGQEEFLELNLHMCGGDDTKIIIYSMERWPKKAKREKPRNFCNNPLNSCNLDHQLDIIT